MEDCLQLDIRIIDFKSILGEREQFEFKKIRFYIDIFICILGLCGF